MRKVSWIFILGFSGFTICAAVGRFETGQWGWLFDIAAQVTPFLLVIGICLSGILFKLRNRRMGAFALVLTAFHLTTFLNAGEFETPPVNAKDKQSDFTVFASNIFNNENALTEFATLANAKSPDVIAISEMTKSSCGELQKQLVEYEFCQLVSNDYDGGPLSRRLAFLSRLPPSHIVIHTNQLFRRRALIEADFEISGKPVKVIFVHPPAPGSPVNYQSRNTIIRFAYELAQNGERSLIMGDFNATPWSRIYHEIPGRRAGDPRLESTWLTPWPILGLPIDHFMMNGDLGLADYKIERFIESDHYPIYAAFQLGSEK